MITYIIRHQNILLILIKVLYSVVLDEKADLASSDIILQKREEQNVFFRKAKEQNVGDFHSMTHSVYFCRVVQSSSDPLCGFSSFPIAVT